MAVSDSAETIPDIVGSFFSTYTMDDGDKILFIRDTIAIARTGHGTYVGAGEQDEAGLTMNLNLSEQADGSLGGQWEELDRDTQVAFGGDVTFDAETGRLEGSWSMIDGETTQTGKWWMIRAMGEAALAPASA